MLGEPDGQEPAQSGSSNSGLSPSACSTSSSSERSSPITSKRQPVKTWGVSGSSMRSPRARACSDSRCGRPARSPPRAAILFVVVLGAAPAIANGLIAGADHIPPILLRAGRVLGARGLVAYRHVILPASLPSFVTGLKQGWAFAWRSLMAGELIVVIADQPSIGFLLQTNRNLADAEGLLATMVVILVIGVVVDSLVFGRLDRAIRRRGGLIDGGP